jgi:asparagine synthase (glutamine-hydrolysing)
MCGVFATTRPDLWRAHVPEILTRLHHRGPDANGVWEAPDGSVLMVHTRLSIIGLDASGAQPATSADGRVTLVYNGEAYNYRELAAGLARQVGRSDTAVLAELVATEGPEAASRVRGMFAFVAWDATTRTLSAVRDAYGIKPLYLLRHPEGGVTLCSEVPPLLLGGPRRVDPFGVVHYLAFGHTGPTATMFEHITKVPPGAVMQWRALPGGAMAEQASRIGPAPAGTPGDDDCSATGTAAALDDSVRSHLVSDVEVGIFLSGGIDSTLIAATAGAMAPSLRTFTISFPSTPGIDESGFAEANARLLGTRHDTIPVRAPAMVAAAARFTEVHGEPFGDAAALPLTVLAQEASQELKVVLTGEGADELVGGYARYRVSSWLGHSPFAAAPLATWWGRRRGDRPWERAAEAVLWGGGPRSHAALLGSDLTTLADAGAPFASDIGNGMRAEWLAGPARRGRGDREVARSLDRERLANTYLEKTDRATMACSLEARVPYLDPALATAFVGAPVDTHKTRLRAELARRLPGAVLPNRKKGLAVNLAELLDGGLAAHLYYELGSSRSVLRSVLGPEPVRALRDRCERSDLSAYRIAMLGQWETTLASSGLLAGAAGTPVPLETSPH